VTQELGASSFAWSGVALGVLASASLTIPWFELVGAQRSPLGLLSTASSLGAVSSSQRLMAALLLVATPSLVAIAVLAIAARRATVTAVALGGVGPLFLVTLLVMGAAPSIAIEVGGWLSLGVAAIVSGAGVVVWRCSRPMIPAHDSA